MAAFIDFVVALLVAGVLGWLAMWVATKFLGVGVDPARVIGVVVAVVAFFAFSSVV